MEVISSANTYVQVHLTSKKALTSFSFLTFLLYGRTFAGLVIKLLLIHIILTATQEALKLQPSQSSVLELCKTNNCVPTTVSACDIHVKHMYLISNTIDRIFNFAKPLQSLPEVSVQL